MWGTLKSCQLTKVPERITPTCVGNTSTVLARRLSRRDHPHLCGEHWPAGLRVGRVPGSPPPVWGTQGNVGGDIWSGGITPTCVGNTHLWLFLTSGTEDHPHLCGEHSRIFANSQNTRGSPPPVWGTRFAGRDGVTIDRITPTCVGNTPETPRNTIAN